MFIPLLLLSALVLTLRFCLPPSLVFSVSPLSTIPAGALTQRALQINQRNPFLFSMELSVFSTIVLISSLILGSPDGKKIRDGQMMEGWTWKTWIPIITNACGGIVVGLVTKHAGAVRKGFALIFGLVLSGVLQSYFSGNVEDKISTEQITGGILASISLWMHSKFPPV